MTQQQEQQRTTYLRTLALSLAAPVASKREMPSGHLYALVMGAMDIDTYQAMVNQLVAMKWFEKRGDLIIWIGPSVA